MKFPILRLLKTIFFLIIFIAVFQGKTLAQQQSIIPDISYLFLEKLIATAKQNYPKFQQIQYSRDIAELNIKRQKISWLDPFNVAYIKQGNSTIDIVNPIILTGYQLGVNVNIGNILSKPYNIRESKINLQNINSEAKEYDLRIEAEIKSRYYNYIQQLNNVKLFTQTLQDAEGMLKELKLKYERGEATFSEYSQGLISFSSTSQSKISSEAAFLNAKASLEELTITRIEDIK